MAPRYFTVAEANRLLPRLEPLVDRLTEIRRGLLLKQEVLEESRAKVQENGHHLDRERVARLRQELEELQLELQSRIAEIEAFGCLVKDLDLGLIDFPSFFKGREVYLCWRLGEKEVAFWHGLDEGFAGRKPITGAF